MSFMILVTLFKTLQEHKIRLKILIENEDGDKKKKILHIKRKKAKIHTLEYFFG